MLAVAVPIGLLIGLSLGALGGGGSILTVPALVYLLHQQPHAATTGSLLIVGITALAGMAAHWRAGRVRVAQGVTFGILGVAGSYAGTRLSAGVAPDLLLTLFAVLMLAAAAAMLRRRRPAGRGTVLASAAAAPAAAAPTTTAPTADASTAPAAVAAPPASAPGPDHHGFPADGSPPRPAGRGGTATLDRADAAARPSHARPSHARPSHGRPSHGWPAQWWRQLSRAVSRSGKIVAAATAVGLLTGFFGVGGGFVIVPALVLALGFDMPAAVGTSLLVIAINSAVALAARLGGHVHLDWPLLAVFTAAAMAGTVAGNHVASRVDASRLTAAFTVLLAAVAVYSLGRSLPGLV
jgi:uncharacterized membrane protein YfcA